MYSHVREVNLSLDDETIKQIADAIAAQQSVQLTGDWNCKNCDELNGARRKTCRICDRPRRR